MTSFLQRVVQHTTSFTATLLGILVALMLYKHTILETQMLKDDTTDAWFLRSIVTFQILFSATVILLIVQRTGTMHMWVLGGVLVLAALLSLQNS